MIDSHCHLDHESLFKNLDEIKERSKSIGIKKLLTICTTLKSFETIKQIINKDKIIYGTYGIHPHEAKNDKVTSKIIIDEISQNDKIIGIGETGLDFYYNHSDKNDQISSMEEHIKAAIELDIPLIIHSRNAENDTLKIFQKYNKYDLKILMHCFTGSDEFAKNLLEFNTYFSASGIITFKNSQNLQNTFKDLPLDRLLVETESLFSPSAIRGKKMNLLL